MNNLEKALDEVFEERFPDVPEEVGHEFSPAFERKMKRLFRHVPAANAGMNMSETEAFPMKKVISVALAAVLAAALAVTAFAVGSDIIRSITKKIDDTHYYYEAELSDGTVQKRSSVTLTAPDPSDGAAKSTGSTLFGLMSSKARDGEPCYMENIDDSIFVTFGNCTYSENFVLKLFLDYEEAEFSVDGIATEGYEFALGYGEVMTVEAKLITDRDMSVKHDLIAAVFFEDENVSAEDQAAPENRYGCAYHETLTNDGCKDKEYPDPIEPDEYLGLFYQGLVLGDQIEEQMDVVLIPPKKISVKRGETVQLSCRTGCYTDGVESVAVVVMLDEKPIKIGGSDGGEGSDYLILKNDPERASYKVIEFTAPSEPGEYELTAFAAPDPFGRKWQNACDLSYKIVLEVE